MIREGLVHYLPWGYQAGVPSKAEPLTFGTVKSKLWKVLDAGHYDVKLTTDEMRAVKCWTDLNCPLWPDYIFRDKRPGPHRHEQHGRQNRRNSPARTEPLNRSGGAVYHGMCRGDHGEPVYRNDADRQLFLDCLGEACGKTGWIVHAYVLMGNHYHLLTETPDANLVAGMQWLQKSNKAATGGRAKKRDHRSRLYDR